MNSLFLSALFYLGIYIHRCIEISMAHNRLDNFCPRFNFAEACAESSAKLMTAKVRKQKRLTPLSFCSLALCFIISLANACNCRIDILGF